MSNRRRGDWHHQPVNNASLLTPQRRFPPPWSAEVTPNCFIVRDANGEALSYIYYIRKANPVAAQRPSYLAKIRRGVPSPDQYGRRFRYTQHPIRAPRLAYSDICDNVMGRRRV